MQKLLTLSIVSGALLTGCNSGGTSASENTSLCPVTAPMFTTAVGEQILSTWATNAYAYSPYGNATCVSNGVTYNCTDPYIGAAFFTGVGYTADAVLLPTLSANILIGSQQLYGYFTGFLAHGPIATLIESSGPYETLAGCGYGVMSGYYDFAFSDGTPSANARYSFQFNYVSTTQYVPITVESGSESGLQLIITQSPGWYIELQNSAQLPS
ncbi:MAG: hypothetical protein KBD37_00525 [Burkholderiales bacterium]|nr:hypothetical protein [Burkholderiales bacterium]